MLKKCIINLKGNLLFLLSFFGCIGLSLGAEKGIQRMVLYLFISLFFACLFRPFLLKVEKNAIEKGTAITLAAAIDFIFLLSFYKRFTWGVLRQIADTINVPAEWLFIAFGLCLCGISFYALYVLSLKLLSFLKPFCKIVLCYRKQTVLLACLFCLSLVALIRSDFVYIDDLARVNEGYQLTGDFGRYTASFLSTFLHANSWLTDISPLPQLLAACILAVACVVMYAVLTDNNDMNLGGLIALIPVGTFPLFLQCYSYKFDAPYMAISLLFSVMPLLYLEKGRLRFGVAAMAGTILMCTTYQASSGIFPMIVAVLCLKMWSQRASLKEIITTVCTAALGYILGMLVFRFGIMDAIGDNYVDTSISIKAIIPNIINIVSLLLERMSPVWIVLIAIIMASYIWSVVVSAKRGKWATLGATIGIVMVMFLLSFGVYIVFEEPLLSPRAMYGMSIPVAIFSVQISQSGKHFLGKAATLLLSISFFVFSFTYGNALKVQKEYTDFRLQMVLADIASTEAANSGDKVFIQVKGTIGRPGQLEGVMNEYPLLDELVPVQFSDSSWYWGDYQLLHYSGLDDVLVRSEAMNLTSLELPVIVESAYHTIRGDGKHLLIELK